MCYVLPLLITDQPYPNQKMTKDQLNKIEDSLSMIELIVVRPNKQIQD